MELAVVVDPFGRGDLAQQPWVHFRAELAARGVHVQVAALPSESVFERRWDAMLPFPWLDWKNLARFRLSRAIHLLERLDHYRERFPETVQIVVNNTDMAFFPYAAPFWRPGDPVLYRTPPYDRLELFPFPPASIWAYEKVWGAPYPAATAGAEAAMGIPDIRPRWARLLRRPRPRHRAGFIGGPTGPPEYRARVARETARVGIGVCTSPRPYSKREHDALMAECDIIVCPRGWGPQSQRHWDAWLSGKPVLTDRACAAVEMIPGVRLKTGVHYLVFEDPRDIPDLVTDWTRPSRREALAEIGARGRRAARSYDALGRLLAFLEHRVSALESD